MLASRSVELGQFFGIPGATHCIEGVAGTIITDEDDGLVINAHQGKASKAFLERRVSRNLRLLRGENLILMRSHFFAIIVRHELEEAILDLDLSHLLAGVFQDVLEVLGVATTILSHTNH